AIVAVSDQPLLRSRLGAHGRMVLRALPGGKQGMNVAADQGFARETKQRVRARIRELNDAGLIGDDHRVGSRLQNRTEALFRPLQFFGLAAQELFGTAQLDKYVDFALQDFRNNRLEQKIHGAQIVAAEELLIAAVGGDKQDGRLQRPFARANQLSRFESI